MGNMIISNARKALEHRIDKYFMDEEVMAVPRNIVKEWLDSQAAITYFESASQFNKEHKDHVHELEAQLAQCKESYADAKSSRDRLQAELDAYDQTHMVLPVDADGVPIKIGDKIQQLNHAGVWTDAMPVIAVDDHGCFALAHGIACDARTYVWGNNCRHVKQRTVEDVLRELVDVARHDSEHWLDDGDIDGFAAEIRELMGVCDE